MNILYLYYSKNLKVSVQDSSTEGDSEPKIRPKGILDRQQMNIPTLHLVGPKGWRGLG